MSEAQKKHSSALGSARQFLADATDGVAAGVEETGDDFNAEDAEGFAK